MKSWGRQAKVGDLQSGADSAVLQINRFMYWEKTLYSCDSISIHPVGRLQDEDSDPGQEWCYD